MATHKERELDFHESMKGRSVRLKGMFLGMRSKALFECLVCDHEWEAEPRYVMVAKGSGCKKCAMASKRKPNLILEDDGSTLKVDISQPSKPEAFMLIDKNMWALLKRESVNRVWPSKKGYPWIEIGGSMVFVHRFIMGFPQTPDQVDHINGVKHDNRTSNLRVVTALENQMNRGFRKTNTSGVIGVSFHKGRWEAKLWVNRKIAHKSRHETKEEAAAARAKAVAEHCGEFAPQSVQEKPSLMNAQLDEIYQSLCRNGGGETAMRGEAMFYEGRPVYPMRSTIPGEMERLLRDA